MQRILTLIIILVLLGVPFAFAGPGALPKQPMQTDAVLMPSPTGSVITASSQQAADAIQQVIAGRVSKESPILVATMVELNDYTKSSPLGRVVMQQIASRLSQYGYRVVESRMRQDMAMIPGQGEFMLSRELVRLMQTQYSAQAALVGSYVENAAAVYCSLRLVRLDDGAVIAAYEYHLPNRGEVRALLRQKGKATVDVGPAWNQLSGRQSAYSANGLALPPVRNDSPRPVPDLPAGAPAFQGNTFQGGQGAGQGGAIQSGDMSFPALGPPERATRTPESNAGIPALGPPEQVFR